MNLRGKTAVLTGASSGLGAEPARPLSTPGATPHLVGRDEERTRATGEEPRAHSYPADFTSLSQTRRPAAQLAHAAPNIHVLAPTAGGDMPPPLTSGGIDAAFQANAPAPWLPMTQPAGQPGSGRILLTNPRPHTNAVLAPHNITAALAGEPRMPGHRTCPRARLATGAPLREFHRRNPGAWTPTTSTPASWPRISAGTRAEPAAC